MSNLRSLKEDLDNFKKKADTEFDTTDAFLNDKTFLYKKELINLERFTFEKKYGASLDDAFKGQGEGVKSLDEYLAHKENESAKRHEAIQEKKEVLEKDAEKAKLRAEEEKMKLDATHSRYQGLKESLHDNLKKMKNEYESLLKEVEIQKAHNETIKKQAKNGEKIEDDDSSTPRGVFVNRELKVDENTHHSEPPIPKENNLLSSKDESNQAKTDSDQRLEAAETSGTEKPSLDNQTSVLHLTKKELDDMVNEKLKKVFELISGQNKTI